MSEEPQPVPVEYDKKQTAKKAGKQTAMSVASLIGSVILLAMADEAFRFALQKFLGQWAWGAVAFAVLRFGVAAFVDWKKHHDPAHFEEHGAAPRTAEKLAEGGDPFKPTKKTTRRRGGDGDSDQR